MLGLPAILKIMALGKAFKKYSHIGPKNT